MAARHTFSLPALAWSARQWWWRTGPLLLAGPLLLLCCGLFAVGVLGPLHAQMEQAQRRLAAQSGNAAAPPAAGSTAGQPLARFYGRFPDAEATYDLIERVYGAAASQNLSLDQGDYKLVHETGGKLSRIDMMLPVKGNYQQVRRFIAQAMRDVPSLALDGIAFQRQRVDDATVEAQVHLSIYMRRP